MRSGICTSQSTFGSYLWVQYCPLQWFRYQGRFRFPNPEQASKSELVAYTFLWGWPMLIHCKIQADTWFCCLDSLEFESIWVKVGLWFSFRSLLWLVRFPGGSHNPIWASFRIPQPPDSPRKDLLVSADRIKITMLPFSSAGCLWCFHSVSRPTAKQRVKNCSTSVPWRYSAKSNQKHLTPASECQFSTASPLTGAGIYGTR